MRGFVLADAFSAVDLNRRKKNGIPTLALRVRTCGRRPALIERDLSETTRA